MKAWATGMRFDMDPEAQRVVVSIIDSETGEVLRTVPTDAVIRVAKMIVQLQGRSVDTRV
jgi:flagellar protein FlaG